MLHAIRIYLSRPSISELRRNTHNLMAVDAALHLYFPYRRFDRRTSVFLAHSLELDSLAGSACEIEVLMGSSMKSMYAPRLTIALRKYCIAELETFAFSFPTQGNCKN